MMLPSSVAKRSLSWKGRVFLVLFGLFLTAVLLELGLRAADALRNPRAAEGWTLPGGDPNEYWAIYDPDLGYKMNPKFGDMNSDGLRDHPIGPKNDRFRLLLLGDSVAVYGKTVDDTFVGHLRANLSGGPWSKEVDVINAGIKGYTNYQELLYLKKYGLKFEPDLVGFEFCFNDLYRFLHSFEVEDGKLVSGTYNFSSEAFRQSPLPAWKRLAQKSRFLMAIRNNVPIARRAWEYQMQGGFSFDYRLDLRTAWQDKPWEDIERQLREAVELGRQRGFKVFLVAIPIKAQYAKDYLARDRDYVLKPQRKLQEICERLEIPYFDLYPKMGPQLFVDDGIHLTAEGRQVAGQEIAAFLTQANLLPVRESPVAGSRKHR